MVSAALQALVHQYGWPEIPASVLTREGHCIDTSGGHWRFPLVSGIKIIDFDRIRHEHLRWSLQRYAVHLARTRSTHAAYNLCTDVYSELIARQKVCGISLDGTTEGLSERLQILFETVLGRARQKNRLWALYRTKCWYVWCADHYPELGFSVAYANELHGMRFPANPKGEAVRSEDPEKGPLHRVLEMPLLREALRQDNSQVFEHLQENAALSLFMAFGRNPANLVWLDEGDLRDAAEGLEGVAPAYVIEIPRIKKRLEGGPRAEFVMESMHPYFAQPVLDLIHANQALDLTVRTDAGALTPLCRPLFVNLTMPADVPAQELERARRMSTYQIARLVQRFIRRHGIKSPLTGELMEVTPRRLRYTYATELVAQGVGRKELARLLDHSDTQHVQVYYAMKGRIVSHLDAAAALRFAKLIAPFNDAAVLERREDGVNADRNDKDLSYVGEGKATGEMVDIGLCGETALCKLFPPYSCYACPKFQPYRHADHARVLDLLLTKRNDLAAKRPRMAGLLDEVIAAVARVVVAVGQTFAGPPAPATAQR